ncbi:MAG: gliding motility-associated C-terminal domain-containing protein, partial [Flavobacteriales bacterium]|nr:gliding motility-associated C-terminal domain-containing protein [Flavobacteriales bacterium]
NQNDGSVSVGPITGGTPNYTHSWSTGATTSFISGLTGGIIYSDTIRDSRGCILVVDAPVSELGGPQGGTVIGSNTTCFDSCNGTASVVGVFGGVPPYTYSWSPGGQTDTVITGLCADTITLSVTDDSSCTSFFPPLIISSPDSIDFGMVVTATTCDSIDNGALATNVSGGTSPYSYLWSTSETTSSIGNLAGGTYGITVTDANGCVSSTTDNVNESTGLAVIASIGDAGCANNQDGFVGLNPSNGVAPYSFVWDPSANNQTTATATGLGVGTYSVTITDGAGCSTDSMFSISSAPAITITPTVSNATCAQSNGSISVAASGGTGGYSYLWSPTGETTSSITGLSAGLDTVRVSDNSGCFEEFVIAVQSASNLSLVSFGVNPTCNTGINGMAWTTASQGTPPYSYSWSPGGQTTDTISGLGVGDYYIQVTDDSGCVAIDTVSLNGVNAITITFNKTDLTCQGSSNGFALANPVGGVLPYQYSWSNSVTTQSNSPLSAGTYYLTVTDANSCTGIDSVSILEPQAISISFNRTNVDCYGQSSGAATALATGGTGPFDYSWATGDQSPTVGSLDSGYHVITVTDANSCMAVDSVQILSADSISNISSITDATCNNATGAVTVITSGGSGPYTYLWSPSASTSASITGLSAGVYTLTTTDDVGCTKVDFYTVNNSNGPAVNVVSDTTTCFGGNDANLTANVTGGTTPYLYQWNDLSQQTTVTATGLSFGIYQVAVTDDANCVSVAVAEVSQPQQISTSISIVDADCGVTGDVSATITASGGQPNYSFQWPASAGNQTSATATGLTTGTYVVTITDNNLCSKTETVIVDENSDLQVSISGADENCAGSGDGSAFSTVTGGVAPYTYAWSNSGSSVGITNLSGGTYIVTITDDIGCTTVDSIVVNSPNALSSSMSTINPQCFGDLTGEATVTVSGGISPYTYNWSPTGQTTQTAITLFADTHIVQVIDDRGCSIIDTAIITSPTMVDATISTTEPGCQDSSGVITVTPFGGSGSGYTYQWDNNANNQTDSTATGLIAGTYDVTITDGSGCTNTFNITLNNAGAHTVTITTTAETCFGANDGTAAANVLGGTSPYTYSWSNGDTSITADSLPVGPVSVTVIDSAGCIVTANDTIDPGTNLSVSLNVNHISCGGTNDGSIFINASGGFPPYSYSWSPNTTNTTDSAVGLSAGTYFITVSDTSSCAYVDSVEILNPAPYTLGITSKDLDCYDDGSGEITISIVGGGNAPFTYSWSNGATDSALVGLDSGSYSVTVTDASNCVEDTTINLTQPDEIVISFTSNNPTCNDSNGTIFSSVNGGVGPLVYAWGGQAVGQTADSAINLAAGAYPLTVTDSTGCAVIDSFPLSNSNAPVITTDSIVDVTCFGLTDAGIYITATSPSLDTPLTYLWTPTNVITEDLINASAGGHTVFVTDTTGCVGIEFYNLNQPDSFEVTFNSTMPSCNGLCDGQIIAEVNGGTLPYAYSWSPGGQTDSSATGLCAGTHVLMVTDSNNCILQDSTILVEPVAIVINIDTLLEPLCVNSGDGQINVTTSGGAGNLTYSWTGPGAFAATSEDISNLDGGLYSLVVSDTSGCQMNLDTTLGTQIDVKIDSLTISDTLICSGDTVNISGYASGASGLVFDWTLNDTLVSNAQIFSQTPIAGTQVYVFTAALGPCTVTDSVSVEVLPGPIVNAGDDIELLEGLCADIGGNPSVPAGVTFVWSPSTSLSSTTEANPETCTEEPLTYYLTGTDVNGCKTTDSILVSIVPEISFLEGFSPNGDGIRDEWIISNLEDFPDVVVEIFNRWGQKLFESSPGYLDPWDGTYNGKSLPIGTYFYVIELNHPNFPDEINGPVTILK